MTTYLVMQDRIADEVRPGSASASASGIEAIIQREILSAIKHYERERFYFNTRVTDTFATVANQEYYGSAALAAIPNLIRIHSMYVTVSGIRYPILPRDFQVIDQAQNGEVTADPPYYFAYHAQQIRLFPIPSTVRTITMADHYRLTALSASGDSNAWTTDAEELIRNRAEAVIWSKVLREPEQGAVCAAAELAALAVLKRETRQRMSNGILRMDDLAPPRRYDITAGV